MRRSLVGLASLGVAASISFVGPTQVQAATWGTPVNIAASGFEPTIDIAPDGTAYVTAATGVPSYSNIWRRAGSSGGWTVLNNLLRLQCPGGGDIDLTVSPTPPGLTDALAPGTSNSISITELWLGSASVCRNDAKGGNGINPNIANELWVGQPFSVPVQDRQWVDAAGNDVVYHLTHQLEGGLVVSKSVDGGITYPVHSLAATPIDQNLCLCPPGNIVAEGGNLPAGAADKVAFVYTTNNGVAINISSNGGLTWSRSLVQTPASGDNTSYSFPIVAADPNNNDLHVAWVKRNGGTSSVLVRTSNNWGSTWNAVKTLTTSGTSVFPWIDAINGTVVVSLYHTTSSSSNGLPDNVGGSASWDLGFFQSTNNGSTWSGLSTPDTGIKTGPICTAGLSCSSGREFGDFQAVALSPANGDVTIAYMEMISGTPWVKSITGTMP